MLLSHISGEQISIEFLVTGRVQVPITWNSLIEVLHDHINLSTLPGYTETVKLPANVEARATERRYHRTVSVGKLFGHLYG